MLQILSLKMKITITILFLFLLLILIVFFMFNASNNLIFKEQAIEIAKQDVAKGPKAQELQDISKYNIIAELFEDGWHVSYISKTTGQLGGGSPEYIIDAKTGVIISKHYQR